MKDTKIEKLKQIVSRNDISGNEKVEMLIIFTENYHSDQLLQLNITNSLISANGPMCNKNGTGNYCSKCGNISECNDR